MAVFFDVIYNEDMNQKDFKPLSIIYTIWIFVHLFVFVGLLFEGVYLATNGIFLSDKISGLIFIALGLVFSLISIQSLKNNYSRSLQDWKKKAILPNKWRIIITVTIFLILFVFAGRILSILAYAGHAAGKLVLAQVYQGYWHTFSINIRSLPLDFIPWIGQWYYIYMVVGWGIAIYKKGKKILKKS